MFTLFEMAAVVLRSASAGSAAPLRIFQVPEDVSPEIVEDDFRRLLKMRGGRRSYGYTTRTMVSRPTAAHPARATTVQADVYC